MSNPHDDGLPCERQSGADIDDLIDTYVGALATYDADAALGTLSAQAVFQSPFNTWRARHLPSVFHARCAAFRSLRVETVIRDHRSAVILWRATVSGTKIQAAEVVSISQGAIGRIDVFLRPADVLDSVERAMVAAWPR